MLVALTIKQKHGVAQRCILDQMNFWRRTSLDRTRENGFGPLDWFQSRCCIIEKKIQLASATRALRFAWGLLALLEVVALGVITPGTSLSDGYAAIGVVDVFAVDDSESGPFNSILMVVRCNFAVLV